MDITTNLKGKKMIPKSIKHGFAYLVNQTLNTPSLYQGLFNAMTKGFGLSA